MSRQIALLALALPAAAAFNAAVAMPMRGAVMQRAPALAMSVSLEDRETPPLVQGAIDLGILALRKL